MERAVRRGIRSELLSFAMFLFMANAVSAAPAELLVAIRNGDHSRVQKLLSAGADVKPFLVTAGVSGLLGFFMLVAAGAMAVRRRRLAQA